MLGKWQILEQALKEFKGGALGRCAKKLSFSLLFPVCFFLLSGCDSQNEKKGGSEGTQIEDQHKSKDKKKKDKKEGRRSSKNKKKGKKDSAVENLQEPVNTDALVAEETILPVQEEVPAPVENVEESKTPAEGHAQAPDKKQTEKINENTAKKPDKSDKPGNQAIDNLDDKGVVQKKMQEIQALSSETMPKWIDENAATIIMKSRVFGPGWRKLSKAQQNEITKTWTKFISLNVSSFLPMIKGLSVRKIDCSKAGQKVKKFSVEMVENSTQKVSNVVILSTNNLRIIDIIAQDVSLLSILKTSANDILHQKGDKLKNWRNFLNKNKTTP
jgi:ABC-type transporter MlaC component